MQKEVNKEVLSKLVELGKEIYKQIERGEFPKIKIPIRSTSNIIFDRTLNQLILGPEVSERSAGNIKQIRSLAQFLWVAAFAKKLIEEGKSSTLRDLFYHSLNYEIRFRKQIESNETVADLEAYLGVPRESFNIFPKERASIFGDITIEYTTPETHKGVRVNLSSNPDGVMIGLSVAHSEFISCNADKVFVIEKNAIFRRFIEERVHVKFNAILIDTAGQAPRMARLLIRRLNEELGLPVYILTDADPWGMHIAMVIIKGSANAAHLRELTTPKAKWIGLWATDIRRFNLPSFPLSKLDEERIKKLEEDPRYRDFEWQCELQEFKKIKRRAELESFSAYGLNAIVEKYLPKKLKIIEEIS
ncbi:MAG: DNA topoisomerase IV subunit A [Candidatus Verstraetearchaeota archaeon]|jgi:DNA topoisomerase-6 subunit A|nr:DNA topoisomerase IV subunit A [Candidatus Verstraetearchaeota archaeon]